MAEAIDQDAIIAYITSTFGGVDVVRPTEGIAGGDSFFSYDPDRNLEAKQRMPFATIVTKDYGDFDCASDLNRPGVFRLNVGVSRDTFRSLFPAPRAESDPNETVSGYDYTAQDTLLPHPVYASQSWVCVLNPRAVTFERTMKPLLTEAYELVAKRVATRRSQTPST